MKQFAAALFALPLLFGAPPALAQEGEEQKNEVTITNEMELPAHARWQHAFDAYEGEAGKENASIRRALGLYRMMEQSGVENDRVTAAVVVHGPAVFDVVRDARYGAKYGAGEDGEAMRNPNFNNVAELLARGGEIWVCGFAARHHGVGNEHLLEGVKMAPSGTVAHAELQRRGFGINPY